MADNQSPRRAAVARFIPCLVLTLPVLLTACNVGEDYQRPSTPAPVAWKQLSDTANTTNAAITADWWRQFNAPRLDGYMDAALSGNLDLAAAIARVRQADAQVRIAGASLLPALDAGGGVNRQQSPALKSGNSSSSKSSKVSESTTYTANLTASYEIDFWGLNAAIRDSALASARASRFDQQTVTLTVQSSVATTYFNIVGFQDRLLVARENLATAEEIMAAISDRLKAGTATDLDVAQQESLVAIARAAIPPLEKSLAQNADALALLVGKLPSEVDVQPSSLAGLSLPIPSPGLPSELLARRPDVLNAEEQLIAANADMNQAHAAMFPSIKLTAEFGYESLALETLTNPGSMLWSLATSASQPIFHGDALQGGVEKFTGRREELVANYRKSVLSAFTDVEDALVALHQADAQEKAEQVVVKTAKRAYDISLDQLRGGIVDITTVLNTQKTLFDAQDALVQARLNHFQAVVSLYKALGGGWTSGPT